MANTCNSMNFEWDAEHIEYRDSLRSFLAKHLPEDWARLSNFDPGSDYVVDFVPLRVAQEFGGMDDALHVAIFVVFFGASGCGERTEIVLTFEGVGGGGHGGLVERPGIVEGPAMIEGREDFAAIDAVTIRFSLC